MALCGVAATGTLPLSSRYGRSPVRASLCREDPLLVVKVLGKSSAQINLGQR